MAIVEGRAAPAFTLPDSTGARVALRGLRGRKVILFFYPKAFTPGCTGEACDFRDGHATLERAGYTIVGISPDPVARLARFREEYGLPYLLLSDVGHAVSEKYGAWGPKINYGRAYEGLIRSTVVVDADGTVVKALHNVRAKGHVAKLTRDLLGT